MPGVKRLHQESSNVSKPEWIRGHYFSALGLLLETGAAVFAVPIVFKLHDGIDAAEHEAQGLTLVDKMAALCITYMSQGSYVVLGRGRPRQWGSAIRLQDLFATSQTCLKAVVCL